jgi:hypothetical protein
MSAKQSETVEEDGGCISKFGEVKVRLDLAVLPAV